MKNSYSFEQFLMLKQLMRWFILIVPISVCTGGMVAMFLWLLDIATAVRWEHAWLIYLLPVAGVCITWIYHYYGKNSAKGNNLIIEEIHEPAEGVPARMTPLILITTILTHLVGGSAGREGTAVQMGGSISAWFSKWFKLDQREKRILLMCGMSAGFGAVFGTPVAGAIFALEVLTIGKIKLDTLIPCLMAGLIADIVCTSTGIHHTSYHISFVETGTTLFHTIHIDLILLMKATMAGIVFGLVGYFFSTFSHIINDATTKYISNKWMVPVVGSVLIIGISILLGTNDYLGLGVTSKDPNGISIINAFKPDTTPYLSWFWKLLLTVITLNMGFKGGEVTPLFFIGATLGNTIAVLTGSPIDLFAGLGFIGVFAGATNTPLACTLMGVELFGADHLLYYAVACFMAYYFSGHTGIYHAQKIGVKKF
jgi:H+/Cl- antiporter ClcA